MPGPSVKNKKKKKHRIPLLRRAKGLHWTRSTGEHATSIIYSMYMLGSSFAPPHSTHTLPWDLPGYSLNTHTPHSALLPTERSRWADVPEACGSRKNWLGGTWGPCRFPGTLNLTHLGHTHTENHILPLSRAENLFVVPPFHLPPPPQPASVGMWPLLPVSAAPPAATDPGGTSMPILSLHQWQDYKCTILSVMEGDLSSSAVKKSGTGTGVL